MLGIIAAITSNPPAANITPVPKIIIPKPNATNAGAPKIAAIANTINEPANASIPTAANPSAGPSRNSPNIASGDRASNIVTNPSAIA